MAFSAHQSTRDTTPYGQIGFKVLELLAQPYTVGDVADLCGWDWQKASSWVHYLERRGKVIRVGWTKGKRGITAGLYQRVTP